ncbi:MAG: sel1 repeat family protein [Deltaproteobacteria bacterium]|nr:sel1 repeat family protein [Deltaproteobacteria bacterium]
MKQILYCLALMACVPGAFACKKDAGVAGKYRLDHEATRKALESERAGEAGGDTESALKFMKDSSVEIDLDLKQDGTFSMKKKVSLLGRTLEDDARGRWTVRSGTIELKERRDANDEGEEAKTHACNRTDGGLRCRLDGAPFPMAFSRASGDLTNQANQTPRPPAVDAGTKVAAFKFPVDEALSAMLDRKLCGRWVGADNSLIKALTFQGNEVTVDNGLNTKVRRFLIHENVAWILLDKAILKLQVAQDRLAALTDGDETFSGHTFVRESNAECDVSSQQESAFDKSEISHLSCYLAGIDLQTAARIDEAMQQYDACCDLGDAVSCNKKGFILELRGQKGSSEFFSKACEMGYGAGCLNAGDAQAQAGNKDEAMKLFARGCELQSDDACLRQRGL